MSAVADGIRILVASAPDVTIAGRQRLESAVVPAAKRHGGAVIRTCHRIEWYRDGAEDPLALPDRSRRGDPGRYEDTDRPRRRRAADLAHARARLGRARRGPDPPPGPLGRRRGKGGRPVWRRARARVRCGAPCRAPWADLASHQADVDRGPRHRSGRDRRRCRPRQARAGRGHRRDRPPRGRRRPGARRDRRDRITKRGPCSRDSRDPRSRGVAVRPGSRPGRRGGRRRRARRTLGDPGGVRTCARRRPVRRRPVDAAGAPGCRGRCARGASSRHRRPRRRPARSWRRRDACARDGTLPRPPRRPARSDARGLPRPLRVAPYRRRGSSACRDRGARTS